MAEFEALNYDSIITQTEQAICFDMGDRDKLDRVVNHWIPKSVIDMDTFEWHDGNEVYIKQWWLYKNGYV